jgi:hypothetical protein
VVPPVAVLSKSCLAFPMVLKINRAPVLTLWGAIVAMRLGHPENTALTLGRAVAGSEVVPENRTGV